MRSSTLLLAVAVALAIAAICGLLTLRGIVDETNDHKTLYNMAAVGFLVALAALIVLLVVAAWRAVSGHGRRLT